MKLKTHKCNKPKHFIDFYNELLDGRRIRRVLEIGVQTGRSLRMWADAFPMATIVGLDIEEPTERLDNNRIEFVRGSQTDNRLLESLGGFDLIIDDGGHMMSQQRKSFELLWPQLRHGGIYIIEDTKTSYEMRFLDGIPMTELIQEYVDKVTRGSEIRRMTVLEDLVAFEKV